MSDFCKKCEIEMFGVSSLNIPNSELILCEGCGGMTTYGELTCKVCHTIIESKMYETGLEHFCKCQCTLDADFDYTKWKGYEVK